MPGGDRTGPEGKGAKTGRGLGYCPDNDTADYTRRPGMGLGRGFRGRLPAANYPQKTTEVPLTTQGPYAGRGLGRGRGRGRGLGRRRRGQ
jgi:hypothetical protein